MNEKLSALMDGELDRTDALAAIKTLGQDAQQRGDWDCYHLIGDAIRGDTPSVTARRKACAESIFARLAEEPTILAPAAISSSAKLSVVVKPATVEKKTRMVLAMAASVVTVTAIGVIVLKQQDRQQDRQQDTATASSQVAKQMPTPSYVEFATASTAASTATTGEVEANKQRVNDYLAIHRQFANSSALRAASTTQAEPRQAAAQ